jgi:hypothetical protein
MARRPENQMVSMWPRNPEADRFDGWERLVSAVVADTVRLADAKCRRVERAAIFDGATRADTVAALKACVACPVIQQCNSWAHTSMRLSGQNGFNGVVGGQLYGAARQWLP